MSRRRFKKDPVVRFSNGKRERMVGAQLLDLLKGPLRALRDSEALPKHGNRDLLPDHILVAHLVAFFNPTAATLRRIEDVFESKDARKRFGLPRTPRTTLSDAQKLFDPSLLTPIIDALKQRLPNMSHDPRLDQITQKLLAVDGTFFAMLPHIIWAIHHRYDRPGAVDPRGHARLDLHLDLKYGTPDAAVVSGDRLSEQDSLADHLEPGCFYILDRGFQAYSLFGKIIEQGSDFVVRFRRDIAFDVVCERPPNADDRIAGVVRDAEIHLRGHRAKAGLKRPQLRLVELRCEGKDDSIILLTNRIDLSAELIGLLYRHRWQIELFFRWLKCTIGFGHFMSESLAGVTLQIYAALIGTLLIAVQTNSKPSVYAFSMMHNVVSGLVPAEEAVPIMARRMRITARDAERAKARRAEKKKQP